MSMERVSNLLDSLTLDTSFKSLHMSPNPQQDLLKDIDDSSLKTPVLMPPHASVAMYHGGQFVDAPPHPSSPAQAPVDRMYEHQQLRQYEDNQRHMSQEQQYQTSQNYNNYQQDHQQHIQNQGYVNMNQGQNHVSQPLMREMSLPVRCAEQHLPLHIKVLMMQPHMLKLINQTRTSPLRILLYESERSDVDQTLDLRLSFCGYYVHRARSLAEAQRMMHGLMATGQSYHVCIFDRPNKQWSKFMQECVPHHMRPKTVVYGNSLANVVDECLLCGVEHFAARQSQFSFLVSILLNITEKLYAEQMQAELYHQQQRQQAAMGSGSGSDSGISMKVHINDGTECRDDDSDCVGMFLRNDSDAMCSDHSCSSTTNCDDDSDGWYSDDTLTHNHQHDFCHPVSIWLRTNKNSSNNSVQQQKCEVATGNDHGIKHTRNNNSNNNNNTNNPDTHSDDKNRRPRASVNSVKINDNVISNNNRKNIDVNSNHVRSNMSKTQIGNSPRPAYKPSVVTSSPQKNRISIFSQMSRVNDELQQVNAIARGRGNNSIYKDNSGYYESYNANTNHTNSVNNVYGNIQNARGAVDDSDLCFDHPAVA